MSIERFAMWCAATHGHQMLPREDGWWVEYEAVRAELERLHRIIGVDDGDYLRVQLERDAMIRECQRLKDWRDRVIALLREARPHLTRPMPGSLELGARIDETIGVGTYPYPFHCSKCGQALTFDEHVCGEKT